MKIYVLSLSVGLLVGVIYGVLNVRSPAPPVIALVGLLLRYRACDALCDRGDCFRADRVRRHPDRIPLEMPLHPLANLLMCVVGIRVELLPSPSIGVGATLSTRPHRSHACSPESHGHSSRLKRMQVAEGTADCKVEALRGYLSLSGLRGNVASKYRIMPPLPTKSAT